MPGPQDPRGREGRNRLIVEVEPDRDLVHLRPRGEIDIATVGIVRAHARELTAAGFRRLVLDLRRVEFIDASGMHMLLGLDTAARVEGWRLAIVDGTYGVARAIDAADLRDQLPIVDPRRLLDPGWPYAIWDDAGAK